MPTWKKLLIIWLVSALPVGLYIAVSDVKRALPLADFLFLMGLLPWLVAFGLSIHMRRERISPKKRAEETVEVQDRENTKALWLSVKLAFVAGCVPVALSYVVSYWPL